jgi:hypothetical protein
MYRKVFEADEFFAVPHNESVYNFRLNIPQKNLRSTDVSTQNATNNFKYESMLCVTLINIFHSPFIIRLLAAAHVGLPRIGWSFPPRLQEYELEK